MEPGSSRGHYRQEFTYEWLAALANDRETAGVYVLRTWDYRGLKHAICIDARYWPSLIYDCAEPHPLKLEREALLLCCGDGNPRDFNKFDDVRRVLRVGRTDEELVLASRLACTATLV